MNRDIGPMPLRWRPYVWRDTRPVVTGELERLESDWGVRLPAEYKELVSLYQGMTPVPNAFDVGGNSNSLSVLLTVTRDPEQDSYSVQHVYGVFRSHIPPGIFPFGDTPGGEPVCFDFRESADSPRVVLVSTEAAIHPVAGSFGEFLAGLYDD